MMNKAFIHSAVKVISISLLVVSSFVLVSQKNSLQEENRELRMQEFYPKVGSWIPALDFKTIEGDAVSTTGEVDGEGRIILVYFSSKCPACIQSAKFISEIARAAQGQGVKVIGFTPEADVVDINEFLFENGIHMPVVSVTERKDLGNLQYRMSPTVLVLSSVGQIKYAKVGLIESDMEASDIVIAALEKEVMSALN